MSGSFCLKAPRLICKKCGLLTVTTKHFLQNRHCLCRDCLKVSLPENERLRYWKQLHPT